MRECLFCTSTGTLTREDLWPQWVKKSVVGDGPSTFEKTIGSDAPTVHGGNLKARCVCEPCNGGWMSLLETHSKPVLEPMIHDTPCVLDYAKQATVSLWTIKTSMVFEYIKRKDLFYSRADRQHVFKWRMPPADTLIWLGRYEERYLPAIEKHALAHPKRYFLGNGNSTMFAIGHLAIQSITARRSSLGEGKGSVGAREDLRLIQIWPPVDGYVRWPPPVSITSEEAKQLPKRFWAG